MIHKDLAAGAEALKRAYAVASDALPELVVAFSIDVELMRRELLISLWRNQ